MDDSLYELLVPHLKNQSSTSPIPSFNDPVVTSYLGRLSTLSLESLTSTEPQSLAQSSHSTLLSLQALSSRSHKSFTASTDNLSCLQENLPTLNVKAGDLVKEIPRLDKQAVDFSTKYTRSGQNDVLDSRKKALLMARNADRLADILDLPALLSSVISASASGGQNASITAGYSTALDLYNHIKRLQFMFPESILVRSILKEAEDAMQEMTSSLINSLRAPGLKLAAAMRTIGFLRRVAPELGGLPMNSSMATKEGDLGALFLVCRLANLTSMLEALDPLKKLAEQESLKRLDGRKAATNDHSWSGGQQTERYLKRYIEIFREQSFAMISMYRSIFPSSTADDGGGEEMRPHSRLLGLKSEATESNLRKPDPLQPLPLADSTFLLHLITLLTGTLKRYFPNVRDKASRESLFTQLLYCAGSLGRLGGDFGMVLAFLDVDEEICDDRQTDGYTEWVECMKRHRILAGRLENLSSNVGLKV